MSILLGFIAAKPIPQVLRNINSYTLGARSVNPKATVTVIFTGDWSMPVKEAEAANSLIDQGVDALTYHVDSPKDRRTGRAPGCHGDRLSRQPGRAGPQGVPDRRRVELGQGLRRLPGGDPGQQALPAPAARRLEGRVREDVPLRQVGLRRGEEEGRRGGGVVFGWFVGFFLGSVVG